MRAILIKGQSVYDATRVFVDELAGALSRRGILPVIVDATTEPDFGGALARASASGDVAFVYSICIAGEWRDGVGRTIGQICGAPHILQHVDYPLTHLPRLEQAPTDTVILTIDPSHVESLTSVCGPGRFAHVGFCPHAAVGEAAPPEPDADAFAAARDIPILFTGTWYRPATPSWRSLDAGVRKLVDNAYQIAVSQEFIPAMTALDQAMRAAGLDPKNPQFAGFRTLASAIHEQVRAHRRELLLKTAARIRLPIHVYGRGWEAAQAEFPNLILGGEANLHEAVALMRRSRVVLNVNANFGAGSHERPLTAMLAGAVAASDHSRFWAEEFRDGREIALYRWKSLETGLHMIAGLADDLARAHPMAQAGQAKALAGHTWDHRVDTLLAAAQAGRAKVARAA